MGWNWLEGRKRKRGEEMRGIKLDILKVIKTENVEGRGTKEDPVRTVVRYWDEKGELLFEKTKTDSGF